MPEDLVSSGLDRRNILNKSYAVSEIENVTGITGLHISQFLIVKCAKSSSNFR